MFGKPLSVLATYTCNDGQLLVFSVWLLVFCFVCFGGTSHYVDLSGIKGIRHLASLAFVKVTVHTLILFPPIFLPLVSLTAACAYSISL